MQQQFSRIPEITKNLIIINLLMFLATMAIPSLTHHLALYPLMSEHFQPYQIVSHMFMHDNGGIGHIFFNMFALFMFGGEIERAFGPKKFLFYYLMTGLGAAFLHSTIHYLEAYQVMQNLNIDAVNMVLTEGRGAILNGQNYTNPDFAKLNLLVNIPVVGASGAVYGLLAAFGLLYPNRVIYLILPPIPLKAKFFVLIFGVIELFLGISNAQTGIAHFAHLGGAIFGVIIIVFWRKQGSRF
ncbi:MAG: rhomboid family intramembrane serine protease [Saprospiraceae bacterium]|nr:rhomboid family intramembrane serine protease [Saprospiraceae bacterium]